MEIFQIELKFNSSEDRLLLRLNSREGSELRFWLTRRFVRGLWPMLEKTLAANPSFYGFDEKTQEAAIAFMQQEKLSNVDLSVSFQENAQDFPLGEVPLLLTTISLKLDPQKKLVLGMYPEKGQGIEFGREHPVVNYLYQHLPILAQEADWDLSLKVASLEDISGIPPEQLH